MFRQRHNVMDRAGPGWPLAALSHSERRSAGEQGPQAGPSTEEAPRVIGRGGQATWSREWPKGGEGPLAPSHTFICW